jgi:ankyrin repeat protein
MEHILKLYTSIEKNNYMEARQLIAKGANVNCINYIGGTPLIETCRTPLLHKGERERESFVRFLITSGAEMDLSDIFGGTAVIYAKQNGLQSIVNILERKERRETGKKKGKIV